MKAAVLDNDTCYRALLSRDARFDGVFYIAVASTKIYCRTICRVKTPLRKNCTFYQTAAEAEAAGYRPCLRCRPELAPGNSSMDAVGRLAQLAMQRIEAGALKDASIADLADDFGVTDRHLRRVMQNELGVSPVEIAQTQRLHLAKRLLTDTALPITNVAYASGFASLRRFNALFKERYRLEPRRFRQTAGDAQQSDAFACTLSYRPPLAWSDLLEFLRARAVAGVEVVTATAYQRTVGIGKHRGVVSVSHAAEKNQLKVELSAALIPVLVPVLARLKKVFDLDAGPRPPVLVLRGAGGGRRLARCRPRGRARPSRPRSSGTTRSRSRIEPVYSPGPPPSHVSSSTTTRGPATGTLTRVWTLRHEELRAVGTTVLPASTWVSRPSGRREEKVTIRYRSQIPDPDLGEASGAPESDDEGWEDEDTAAAEGEAGGAAGAEEAGDAASPEAPAAPVAPTPAKIPAQFMLDGAGLSARGDLCRR